MLAVFSAGVISQAPIRFDRIDVLNEEAPSFLHYDVTTTGVYPAGTALRFIEQLKVVVTLPVDGLYLGASLRSQSLTYEGAILRTGDGRGLFWSAGLSTRLLMPYGAQAGIAWRFGVMRLGIGVQAASGATWARPAWSEWQVLPTIGLGFGPNLAPGMPSGT